MLDIGLRWAQALLTGVPASFRVKMMCQSNAGVTPSGDMHANKIFMGIAVLVHFEQLICRVIHTDYYPNNKKCGWLCQFMKSSQSL